MYHATVNTSDEQRATNVPSRLSRALRLVLMAMILFVGCNLAYGFGKWLARWRQVRPLVTQQIESMEPGPESTTLPLAGPWSFGGLDWSLQSQLLKAEEVDHLVWCNERLTELGSRPSLLNPVWYAGSFALGVMASVAGVPRNLGFMAETERQVEDHLDEHLRTLPVQDERSRQIVQRMKEDEAQHRASAEQAGGVPLPTPVKTAMRAMSKVMTTTAYWI